MAKYSLIISRGFGTTVPRCIRIVKGICSVTRG